GSYKRGCHSSRRTSVRPRMRVRSAPPTARIVRPVNTTVVACLVSRSAVVYLLGGLVDRCDSAVVAGEPEQVDPRFYVRMLSRHPYSRLGRRTGQYGRRGLSFELLHNLRAGRDHFRL